jgi:hypothetical protein
VEVGVRRAKRSFRSSSIFTSRDFISSDMSHIRKLVWLDESALDKPLPQDVLDQIGYVVYIPQLVQASREATKWQVGRYPRRLPKKPGMLRCYSAPGGIDHNYTKPTALELPATDVDSIVADSLCQGRVFLPPARPDANTGSSRMGGGCLWIMPACLAHRVVAPAVAPGTDSIGTTGREAPRAIIESISALILATHDMPRAARFYAAVGFDLIYGGADARFTGFRLGLPQLDHPA